jgi:DNA polymerase-3 subunit gamma/tau
MAKQKAPPPPAKDPAAEGYTVLARRYRPQQFTELVGQDAVAQALANAIKTNRVAHAYLFTGARGVGKTSTARILAKSLNCVQGPTATPCGTCEVCRSIASGEDVDVLEIDGASNRGIDEVREIRNNVQFRPTRSRFKIYIIDEVHMLTPPAFNALLKTLEEPPPHVKFIFATTEVQKIPVTILSRCQRFDFPGIGTPQIVERLRDIVTREGMEADDEALELVARRAGGSMRDSQSLLDQLLAFGGNRLTADQVHQLLGTARDDRVLDLAAAVLAHDAKRSLDLLGEAAAGGAQLGELLDQLIAYWRDLMVLNCAGGQAADLSVAPRHKETLARQAAAVPLDTLLAGLDILATTKARLRGSNHGRTLLEMAVVRLARLEDLVSVTQLAQLLAAGGEVRKAAPTAARTTLPPEAVKKKLTGDEPAPANGSRPLSPATLQPVWQEVLGLVGPMFSSKLQSAGFPAIIGPNTLVLAFPPGYNESREYCQEVGRVSKVEELLRKITGHPWQVRLESVSGVPADPDQTPGPLTPTPPRHRRPRAEALQQEPLLKRAIDVLGAQVLHADEEFGVAPPSNVAGAAGPAGGREAAEEEASDGEE